MYSEIISRFNDSYALLNFVIVYLFDIDIIEFNY